MRVCVIPARGGSTRIPRKNIRPFHGKPIIAYSIEAAKASKLFDVILVSTEDSEIADVALRYGALVMRRPDALALDLVGTQEVMRDALLRVSSEYACCIYATAPLITASHLIFGYGFMRGARKYAYVTGGYYWGRTEWFVDGIPLTTDHSVEITEEDHVDINDEADWVRAERMYKSLTKGDVA